MEKRLQSIKLPRDLTLGGTKPKKTFTPNLNVTRNKPKAAEVVPVKPEDNKTFFIKKERRKPGEKSERFIQSSGIFSDGMGSDLLKKVRFERAYSSRDDPSTAMPMPKVKKDEWKVNKSNEGKVYEDIMGGSGRSTVEEDEQSPFAPVSWNEGDLKETSNTTTAEVNTPLKKSITKDMKKLEIKTVPLPKEFEDTHLYSDYNPAITLWNMPDSFAGKGLTDDPKVDTLFDYKLEHMLEGQIGTMKIYKSGRIEVYIGYVKYEIEPAQLESFSEKVVAMDTQSSVPTSIVLGNIQNRYILNPDWNYLLEEIEEEQKDS